MVLFNNYDMILVLIFLCSLTTMPTTSSEVCNAVKGHTGSDYAHLYCLAATYQYSSLAEINQWHMHTLHTELECAAVSFGHRLGVVWPLSSIPAAGPFRISLPAGFSSHPL